MREEVEPVRVESLYKSRLTIKDLDLSDRPREKLLVHGADKLSDSELLAILLCSGTTTKTVVELAQEILAAYNNNLSSLAKASVEDLMQNRFAGVGPAKAATIVAALELNRRMPRHAMDQHPVILSSKAAYQAIQSKIEDKQQEEVWLLTMNRAGKLINCFQISTGGVSGAVVDIKLILKRAINNLASTIILAHNHPSGEVQPSHEDKRLTSKLSEAAKLIEIPLVDHIIVGDGKYYSFADEGQL